uniref:BED-type domain-containing protein n=1 Tax=Acrobeloides nanus TaxID=290746 RepID=A0A914ENX3_9BILA
MSDIWKHFEKTGDKSRCKIQSCKKEVCRKQGSTKGMWVHLERQHREEFNKLKDIGSDGQKGKQQNTILNYVAPKNVVNEQEEAEEQLARVMIRQNASFYFFDDSDLMALFVKAFPNIKPHGREHFRRVVIPRMASKIRRRIKEIIGTSFYAITANGWSQPTKSPQLQSITMHCLDENFCRHDMVLATLCMDGLRHSGENIAERITECLAKNDFALNKIACCVRDDARNMQSAAKELDTESL